jgi:hypothetical protein
VESLGGLAVFTYSENAAQVEKLQPDLVCEASFGDATEYLAGGANTKAKFAFEHSRSHIASPLAAPGAGFRRP